MEKTAQCQAVLFKYANSFKVWLVSWKSKKFFQHWIKKTGSLGSSNSFTFTAGI